MSQILIYKAEREAGLVEALRASGRIIMAAQALPDDCRSLPARLKQAIATNLGQMDLYYLKSVLVSTGINKNDDFFENLETWAARRTPEDKPFNYEHKQDDIIGHITDCRVIGADGKDIPDDVAVDELPTKFHILTAAVLYRNCEAEERQKRTDRIIAELPQNKWFVSMEAHFTGFDYVVIPQNGDMAQAKIVARNQQTCWLTKHLRAYGGTGKFQDSRIGRVLRNITFAGKGLVRNPANPESVIFTADEAPGEGTAAKIITFEEVVGYETGKLVGTEIEMQESETMAIENTDLQKQIAELVAENKKLNEALAASQAKDWEKQVANLREELKTATEATKTSTDKVVALEAKAKEDETKLTEALEAKTKVEATLATVEAEKRLNERLVKVKATYKVEDPEAKTIADTLTNLSDEQFTKYIEVQTSVLAKVSSAPTGDSKVSGLPAPMAGEAKPVAVNGGPAGTAPPIAPATTTAATEEETEVPAEGSEAALAAAKPNGEAAGAVAAEITNAGVEELQQDIMAYWGRGKKSAE